MKRSIYRSFALLAMLWLSSGYSGFAQTNDAVPAEEEQRSSYTLDYAPGVNAVQKSSSWWKARTESSPENRASWLGLYQSEYYTALKNEGKEFKNSTRKELTDIEERLKLLSDQSYEYHAVAYQNRFMEESGKDHLEALNALRPNQLEWMDDLAAYALFNNKTAAAKVYLTELKKSGVYAPVLMNYQRKVLATLPPNAVLLTHGNTDTYPLLILQMVDGLRKDVTILSVDHLKNASYREKMLELLGVGADQSISDQPYIALETLSASANRPLHVSLTFPAFWLRGHAKTLYFKGLTYQWSPEVAIFGGFGAMSFYSDQLKDLNLQSAHSINKNYLPVLIKAMREAEAQNATGLVDEIRNKIRSIADQSPQRENILKQITE